MNTRDAVTQMVKAMPGGQPAMAAALGMTDSAFHNRRYECRGQAFDLEQFLAMQSLCGQPLFAEAVAQVSGGVFIALPEVGELDNEELLVKQSQLIAEVGRLAADLSAYISDGSLSTAEHNRLREDARSIYQAAIELVSLGQLIYGER